MFIKVTRSAAISAFLSGKIVFCGPVDNHKLATGAQTDSPSQYSRRQAAAFITRFHYGDAFYSKYRKTGYWIYQ